ncbi:hypothetical protein W911_06165 [Hyphomicrobium nitrativorans NL23]|uniref:Uncharacterized protein n=1 Tax=Hyphomicrobium nitrativorans NL23 TaxID=1029756 RepID=V5SB32_9HYPH|nr:hypothetical protein [Hyphomicrobium nitrativorans]AHB48061.1 hypothetical protein W911_06165 [Hyphomicrobium nitrativorans NL23]
MSERPLKTYEDWRHCIEVACGIEITPAFLNARIAELSHADHSRTRRFVEVWGEAHRARVLNWFEQARNEQGPAQADR